MNKINTFLKENIFNIILLLVYLIITLILMFNHELWRDETQVWCIVRDCNILDIINKARLEGHPLIWYFLLLPFAKLGCSVFSMQVISFILVFLSIVFLLFKSTFNKYIKTVVVFSSGMLYFLPIVARNYSLIPLFLFILADLYPKRKQRPYLYILTLILLSNTHLLMFGFCLALSLLFAFELFKDFLINKNIKKLIPVFILSLNFIFIFLMFYNMQHQNHAVIFYAHQAKPFLIAVKNYALIYFQYSINIVQNFNAILFYLLFLILFIFLFLKSKKIFFILFSSFVYIFYIFYKVWFQGIVYQKAYLLILIVLFCYWIYEDKEKNKLFAYIVAILFFISSVFSVFNIFMEINYNFSATKQVAEYIKNNLNNESKFYIVGYPFAFTSISAYLPDKKFYSYINNYYISYYDFNSERTTKTEKEPDTKYYIVQSDFVLNDGFKEIYKSDDFVLSSNEYKEAFKIYVKEND